MTKAEQKAREIVKGLSDNRLFSQWELTGIKIDRMRISHGHHEPEIYMVRGWLMDEIEARYPEAFERWLEGDAEDEDLRRYCMAA